MGFELGPIDVKGRAHWANLISLSLGEIFVLKTLSLFYCMFSGDIFFAFNRPNWITPFLLWKPPSCRANHMRVQARTSMKHAARSIPSLISTAHACTQPRTRAQTPCCRANIWTVTSYSIRSVELSYTLSRFNHLQELHSIEITSHWILLIILSGDINKSYSTQPPLKGTGNCW